MSVKETMVVVLTIARTLYSPTLAVVNRDSLSLKTNTLVLVSSL